MSDTRAALSDQSRGPGDRLVGAVLLAVGGLLLAIGLQSSEREIRFAVEGRDAAGMVTGMSTEFSGEGGGTIASNTLHYVFSAEDGRRIFGSSGLDPILSYSRGASITVQYLASSPDVNRIRSTLPGSALVGPALSLAGAAFVGVGIRTRSRKRRVPVDDRPDRSEDRGYPRRGPITLTMAERVERQVFGSSLVLAGIVGGLVLAVLTGGGITAHSTFQMPVDLIVIVIALCAVGSIEAGRAALAGRGFPEEHTLAGRIVGSAGRWVMTLVLLGAVAIGGLYAVLRTLGGLAPTRATFIVLAVFIAYAAVRVARARSTNHPRGGFPPA